MELMLLSGMPWHPLSSHVVTNNTMEKSKHEPYQWVKKENHCTLICLKIYMLVFTVNWDNCHFITPDQEYVMLQSKLLILKWVLIYYYIL